MDIKAVIFDMDGVIFDTEAVSQRRWFEYGDSFGFYNIKEVYPKIIGTNSADTRRIMINEYKDAEKVAEFLNVTRERFFEILRTEGIPLKLGVKELLFRLKAKGYRTALASSTATDTVKSELSQTGLIDYFDFIIGGDKVKKSKPNPEIFLKAAEGLGVSVSEAIIIEDSHNGIRAASRAGIFSIMVPDLMPVTDEMKSLAGLVLCSLFEVKEFILKQ